MNALSVVVPLYNEQDNVMELHQEIVKALSGRCEFEIIFVDDGSTDQTAQVARALKPLKYIQLRRNYGQTSAMDAGIKAARHPYIATLDGDLQNDPADILRLMDYLVANDLDIVSGWRKKRHDSLAKKFVSRGANLLRSILVKDNIHDSGCTLKLYKKECFSTVTLYGEMHRFIPAILKIKGFKVGEVEVNHRPRTHGVTKYNWKRTVKGFLDMISVWFWNKYAVRPLHLLGGFGLVSLALGFGFGLWTVLLAIQGMDLSNSMQPFMALFFIGLGFLFLMIGLIADMMTKIYYGLKIETPYNIRQVLDSEDMQDDQTINTGSPE
ncbi:MAG: glycosyltransferase [Clostridia bacterium]|nr:glycosyltransferase [Clostridia bacterium]